MVHCLAPKCEHMCLLRAVMRTIQHRDGCFGLCDTFTDQVSHHSRFDEQVH